MNAKEWAQIKNFKPDSAIDDFGEPEKMFFPLMFMIDRLRDFLGVPIYIHGGFEAGHSPTGYHKRRIDGVWYGMAVDFHTGSDLGLYTQFYELERFWRPLWVELLNYVSYFFSPVFRVKKLLSSFWPQKHGGTQIESNLDLIFDIARHSAMNSILAIFHSSHFYHAALPAFVLI